MRSKRTRYDNVRNRQVKKPRRQLLLSSLLVVLLTLGGYGFASFGKNASLTSTGVVASQSSPLKDAQLAWPGTGQAAIGSTEHGLLAHSSNEELRPMASIAKVIVALAILEKQPLESGETGPSYTVTAQDARDYHAYVAKGGSVMPVYEGMELTQYQALQAILLPSANNVADMLVERTFGSMDAYVSYAHDMLERMGLRQTVVADASGFSPATVSTPSELITVGIAALKNPVIAEIVDQQNAYIPGAGRITNTNELLGDDGVIGIKTGTTDQAGNCLLFAGRYADPDGKEVTIVGVIMGDKDASSLFSDSRNLLASAKQGFGIEPTDSENTVPKRQRDPTSGHE